MFTGIIQDLGTLQIKKQTENGVELSIKSELDSKHFIKGNSIAVDGVCLTVESYSRKARSFKVTAIPETLKKSRFSELSEGTHLNIETPLTLNTPVAGHFVSGHVDTVAEVINSAPNFEIEIPSKYLRFFPSKGSITVNGVSLTIAQATDHSVQIAIIPETMRSTNLGELEPGDHVNIEIDVLARYLDQLQNAS